MVLLVFHLQSIEKTASNNVEKPFPLQEATGTSMDIELSYKTA